MTISHESYSFMTMCFRNLCQIFLMGFLYYAVFHYLIQRGHLPLFFHYIKGKR